MTKRKIIIIVLSFVLVVGGVAGYFIFRNNRKLNFDYQSGKIAYEKVTNAQYTPDLDKFISMQNNGQAETYSSKNSEQTLSVSPLSNTQSTVITTEEEFSSLIDDYATIENYAGAGKYQGYDIYEIKNEIQYVVENVPAFNQWFRMPSMRDKEGYISIPYYENWAYYLEMNDGILSITRVCWCTRSSYIDFDNKIVIEEHDDGSSFVQYEIMKTNYYINADGNEVVECYIYSVGIDNVIKSNKCNTNTEDYYPFEYQYLKNVKDKSLIKYHITVAERYANNDPALSEYNFNDDNSAMDIRGLNPYGVRREFIVANYDGYQNIEVTQIDQKFATLDYPYNSGEVMFDLNSDNIKMLISNIGLSQKDYKSSKTPYDLMDKIAKQIIDNFEIKNNWADIYKESTDAIEADIIKGPFYGETLPVSYLRTRMSFYGDNVINGDIDATIVNPKLLETGAEYSWSLALKSDSDIYIIATDYHKLENNVENVYIESDYSWKYLTDVNIDKDGEYVLTVVLTKKVNNSGKIKDEIVLDTMEPMFVIGHRTLAIASSTDKEGKTHVYSCKSRCGKLTVTVTSQED